MNHTAFRPLFVFGLSLILVSCIPENAVRNNPLDPGAGAFYTNGGVNPTNSIGNTNSGTNSSTNAATPTFAISSFSFSYALAATNTNISMTVTVSNPSSLSLGYSYSISSGSGTLLGSDTATGKTLTTPLTAGTVTVQVTVTNNTNVRTSSATLTVEKPWVTIGSTLSTGNATNFSYALRPNGLPVVGFLDSFTGLYRVLSYDGSSWGNFGTSGLSIAGDASLTFDSSDNAYLAYNQGQSVLVQKYDGSSWSILGTNVTTMGRARGVRVNSSGTIYLLYQGGVSNKICVVSWNGGGWSFVGSPNFSSPAVTNSACLELNASGFPVVGYPDTSAGYRLSALQWDGSAWSFLGGTTGVSSSYFNSCDLITNSSGQFMAILNPVVDYSDTCHTIFYDGSSWNNEKSVGPTGGSPWYNGTGAFDGQNQKFFAFSKIFQSSSNSFVWNGSSWVADGFQVPGIIGNYPRLLINSSGTRYLFHLYNQKPYVLSK